MYLKDEMTKEDILMAIEAIRNVSDDDEQAHVKENALREAFIEYIAKRKDSLGEKAKLILSTNNVGFDRHCA